MRTPIVVSAAFMLCAAGLSACAAGSDDNGPADTLDPPDGGGFNTGDGGGQGGSGAYGGGGGSGTGGGSVTGGAGGQDGGGVDSGPACADEYKRCAHEFTYPAATETSVEVRGSFSADGWEHGVPMTRSGAQWTASVAVPYDFPVQYQFVVDGVWKNDPANSNQVSDGRGGTVSVLEGATCANFTCASEPAPASCSESERTCGVRFSYPFGGETSVALAGTFNSWTPAAMTHDGSLWTTTVDGVAWGSTVQYKFVINGTDWVEDPGNPNKTPDGYGGFNSVMNGATCGWWACSASQSGFDWRDAVLYFVFVDRFRDGNVSNNGSPTGNGVQTPADWQGGDWAGVREKVEEGYFNDLGVNVLWISAPMGNTSAAGAGIGGDTHMYSAYHGYWPSELDQTEEHFGTMAELQALVDAAHARGIRVIADYVMNHVHVGSAVYQQHQDWFWPNDNCVCGSGCSWDGAEGKRCWFTDYLADFDFTRTDARNFSVDNAVWWIQQSGVDGFRLDAVKHIEDQWIIDLRNRVKTEVEPVTQEHFYMVGETFTGDRGVIGHYVGSSMLDGQFEFPLRLKLVSTLLTRAEGMGALDAELGSYETYYGPQAIMSTFVGNHDVPRPIHFAQDAPISTNPWYDGKDRAWANQPALPAGASAFESLANAFTVLFTVRGVPLVYYGDEVGLPGAGDPDNRRFMQWSGYSAGQSQLLAHIKKLGAIRAAHPALRRGTRTTLSVSDDTYAYKMETAGDTVLVLINRSDATRSIGGLPAGSFEDLLRGTSVQGTSVDVPPRSSMILIAK